MLVVTVLFCRSGFSQRTIRVPADVPTIQAGINASSDGDTVLVSPGTYDENINFKGKAITVTSGASSFADTLASSTFISGASDGPVVVFASNESSTSILNGFTIQNAYASPASGLNGAGISISNASPTIINNNVANNTGCGIFVYDAASPVIQGNDIKKNGVTNPEEASFCNIVAGVGAGAGANSGTGLAILYANNVQVIGNTIEGNVVTSSSTLACAAGVFVEGSSEVILKNNIIRNNQADCNPAFGETLGVPASKLLLIQNLIYGNTGPTSDTVQVFVSGTDQTPYPSVTEINNTIYGLSQEIILGFVSSTIENNIFVNTLTASPSSSSPLWNALWCADPGIQPFSVTFGNNDIFNLGQAEPSECPTGTDALSVDPQFTNAAADDFHVKATSPIIAAGDLHAPDIPPTDLAGKARIVCNTIDMGAYQFRPHPPVALTSSENPAPGGSNITFTARLTGNCNVPTGTITFLDGSTAFGTGTLNGSAVASLTTSFLVVGQHDITAHYPGDFNFGKSTSAVLVQTITGDPTSTSLSVSPNPAAAYSPITLSSSVTSQYGIPTGSVSFNAGPTLLATAALNAAGRATATVSTLVGGSYSITANYTADTRFQPSSSSAVQEMVSAANTVTVLTATPNPAILGQAVTLTATVSASHLSGGLSGAVTFLDGSTVLGSGKLGGNGTASLTTTLLSLGTHSLTASYGGSTSFASSTSGVVKELINVPALGFTLSTAGVTAQTITAGQSAIYTFAVAPLDNGNYPGTVIFAVMGLPPGGSYAVSPATLAAGAGAQMLTLKVGTELPTQMTRNRRRNPWSPLSSEGSVAVALLVLPFARTRRRGRGSLRDLLLPACFLGGVALLLMAAGCGVTTGAGAPANYTITLTATSGSEKHAAEVTLVLKPPRR